MPIDWNALPGLSTRVEPGHVPDHFGNLPAELTAVSDDSRNTVTLTDVAWIRCAGEDAKSFLHNQLTSDVMHLVVGRWHHSSWCNAKGRMLANFMLVRQDDSSFLLGLPTELAASIAKRLKMYVLRSNVSIEDLSDQIATLALKGEGVVEILAGAGCSWPDSIGEVATGSADALTVRTGEHECLVTVASDHVAQVFPKLVGSAQPAGLIAWRLAEVRSGVPVVRRSTQEEFVPQMVNFDRVGVSFHKGCYPGQEIIARTQYLGKVKRHLYRVSSASEITTGQALFNAEPLTESASGCGTVANAAPSPSGGWVGLAVILETAVGLPVHAGAPDGPVLSNIDLVAA